MQENSHFEQTRKALEIWKKDGSLVPTVSGVFECHIFCDPLEPSKEEIQRFAESCTEIGTKPLCLGLDFAEVGVVNVLQTSKYYQCDDVPAAVSLLLKDAEALGKNHNIIRLKLEAVTTNKGVPSNVQEESYIPGDCYFEYHLKINSPPTAEADERLKSLSRSLTKELNIPVPFSCNNMKTHSQRFLNARTYGMGTEESFQVVDRIVKAAQNIGLEVTKIISEFIVFDTNKELDRGWLEI